VGGARGPGRSPDFEADIVESVFELQRQADAVAAWSSEYRASRVLVADFGKNSTRPISGCQRAGLNIAAIADNAPAFTGMCLPAAPAVFDDAAAMHPELRRM